MNQCHSDVAPPLAQGHRSRRTPAASVRVRQGNTTVRLRSRFRDFVVRAQAEVAGGLSIAQPVLLLHAGRSAHPKEWNADVLSADPIVVTVGPTE